MFKSIKVKILVLITGLLGLAVSASFITTIWISQKSQQENLKTYFERSELILSNIISTTQTSLAQEAKLIGILPIMETVIDYGDPSTVSSAASSYQKDLDIPILDIFDIEGELLTSVGKNFVENENIQTKELIELALEGAAVNSLAIRNGKLAILAAAPIGTGDDPNGVILVGKYLDSNFLKTFYDQTRVHSSIIINDKTVDSSFPQPLKPQDYVSNEVSIFDDNDRKIATFKKYLSLRSFQESIKQLILSIILIAAATFLLSIIAGFITINSITKPISKLNNLAQFIIKTKDLSHRSNMSGRDDVATLGKSLDLLLDTVDNQQQKLDEYAKGLEKKIEESTLKLRNAEQITNEIFDNMHQAIFTFNSEFKINPRYSKCLNSILGPKSPIGMDALDYIFDDTNIDSVAIDNIRINIMNLMIQVPVDLSNKEAIKEKQEEFAFQWELLDSVMIKEVIKTLGETEQSLKLSFNPILDEVYNLTKVLVVVEDVTEFKRLEKTAAKKEEHLQKLSSIINIKPAIFDSFIDELYTLFYNCALEIEKLKQSMNSGTPPTDSLNKLFRYIHTIKGNSRLFDISTIQNDTHRIEDKLAELINGNCQLEPEELESFEFTINSIKQEIDSYTEIRQQIFGDIVNEEDLESKNKLFWVNSMLAKLSSLAFSPSHSIRTIDYLQKELEDYLLSDKSSLSKYKVFYNSMASSIASNLGKSIDNIDIYFNEKRFSKRTLGKINNIIVHLLRNAIDHGIECVEERVRVGKTSGGNISIKSEQTGNRYLLRISDDGGGIDPQKIIDRSTKLGLVSPEEAQNLSLDETYNLIFSPGFSTQEDVSDISGRGVGMDYVKATIEELSGQLKISSTPGKGTTFSILLPNAIDTSYVCSKTIKLDEFLANYFAETIENQFDFISETSDDEPCLIYYEEKSFSSSIINVIQKIVDTSVASDFQCRLEAHKGKRLLDSHKFYRLVVSTKNNTASQLKLSSNQIEKLEKSLNLMNLTVQNADAGVQINIPSNFPAPLENLQLNFITMTSDADKMTSSLERMMNVNLNHWPFKIQTYNDSLIDELDSSPINIIILDAKNIESEFSGEIPKKWLKAPLELLVLDLNMQLDKTHLPEKCHIIETKLTTNRLGRTIESIVKGAFTKKRIEAIDALDDEKEVKNAA